MRNIAGGIFLFGLINAVAVADTVTAPSSGHVRVLDLQGAPNFRDIGGYATVDGRHIRWGRVYRSNDLSKLTQADEHRVESLHLAAVIDLRTSEERAKSPSEWIVRPLDVFESPKTTLAPVMRTILKDAQTLDGARTGIKSFYSEMPDNYRAEYAAVLHRVAAGEFPLLVHCTAGKDRTGVAIAVLLATAGVPRQTVIDDYAMTDKLVPVPGPAPTSSVLEQLPEGSRRALWQSDPSYIEAALNSIDREYGSVDAYVKQGLGVNDSEIRSIKTLLTR